MHEREPTPGNQETDNLIEGDFGFSFDETELAEIEAESNSDVDSDRVIGLGDTIYLLRFLRKYEEGEEGSEKVIKAIEDNKVKYNLTDEMLNRGLEAEGGYKALEKIVAESTQEEGAEPAEMVG